VIPLHQDRVRRRRWEAKDTDLGTVIEQLRRLESELMEHDLDGTDHPHPRNTVLNLVVKAGDHHRAEIADRMIVNICASHPLRAIVLHVGAGTGAGTLDAEITAEAHQLLSGFPVQREQVLLHVGGETAQHLSSLVQPLLVPDLPTYLWWSGREHLDEEAIQEVMGFSDALVVDSARFERPARSLLELAALASRPDVHIGVSDLCWGRLRPWRDVIAQCFAPADRRVHIAGLRELEAEAAGSGPESRVGAALLAGWVASALSWAIEAAKASGEGATEAVAKRADGEEARIVLRSVEWPHVPEGGVLAIRLDGHAAGRDFRLAVERDRDDGNQARVSIDFGNGSVVHQRLTLPRMDDPDLLVHVLWAARRDPVFDRALAGARVLLEALR
jgi:glucose-6-phosphate dehydrogenase assembly protein OpcA